MKHEDVTLPGGIPATNIYDVPTTTGESFLAKLVPGLSPAGLPIILVFRGGVIKPDDESNELQALAEILYQSGRKTIPGPCGTRIWSDDDIAWARSQLSVAPPQQFE